MSTTDRIEQIQQLLTNGFPGLRFPPDLERAFLWQSTPARLRQFFFSGALSLLVYNGFLIVDYLMMPDVFWLSVQLRLLVFSPMCLVGLGLIWRFRHAAFWQDPRWLDLAVLCSGLLAAFSLFAIVAKSNSVWRDFYQVGFAVVVMYGNLVQRLRFNAALAFSVILQFTQVGCVLWLPHTMERVLWPLTLLMLTMVGFSLFANYAMERDERRRFLLALHEKELSKELAVINKQLQQLSRVDVLTALYNRRHLHEYLDQCWARASRDGTSIAIIMMDVDHFKAYNDFYGHPQGDACLKQVAEVMQGSLRRPGDLVARYGGEEFIAVLPNADLDTAMAAAERLRSAVEGLGLPHARSGVAEVVTASVGAASVVANMPGVSPHGLIAAADQALYQAKRAGRNRVAAMDAHLSSDLRRGPGGSSHPGLATGP